MIYLNKIIDQGVDIDLDSIEKTLNLIILPPFLQGFDDIYVTIICVEPNDRKFEITVKDNCLYVSIPLDYKKVESG